jgi:nitroreductase
MWEALAEYARWTPSPHNVQPWQHVAVAARAGGFEVEPDYADVAALDSGTSEPALFARLRLVPAVSRGDFDPELILARRTSRVAYDGRPVSASVLAELADICSA